MIGRLRRLVVEAKTAAGAARRKFVADNLDQEPRIGSYQWFYYPMVVLINLYCAAVADEQTAALQAIGQWALTCWLVLGLACPVLALTGRVLTAQAAKAQPLQPNPGVGGAYLQLTGDGGVWATILIYFACWLSVFDWGDPLYTTGYFLMGIPGGFMFTVRSVWRVRQTRRRARLIRLRLQNRGLA